MSMKKILNEWRRFINEGVSEHDRVMAYIDRLNKSPRKAKVVKPEIASIYLIYALGGGVPKVGREFIQANKEITLKALEQLIELIEAMIDNELHEFELGPFLANYTGSLGNKKVEKLFRISPIDLSYLTIEFESPNEALRIANALYNMIEADDYDFSKIKAANFEPPPGKPLSDRGADQGTGGIQKPDNLTPAENIEFEKRMEQYARVMGKVLDMNRTNLSKDHLSREDYQILLEESEAAIQFFSYLKELWVSHVKVKGPDMIHPNYHESSMITLYDASVQDAFESAERYKEVLASMPPDRGDPYDIAMSTSDKAEAEQIMKDLQASGDTRWRDIRMRTRSM